MHKFIYLILAQRVQVNYWQPKHEINRDISMLFMQKSSHICHFVSKQNVGHVSWKRQYVAHLACHLFLSYKLAS